MTKSVLTIQENEPLKNAYKLMKHHDFRHLPVANKEGKLVGILSDRDIQRAMHIHKFNPIETTIEFDVDDLVSDFMASPVHTASEDMSIADCAKLLVAHKISSVVVTSKTGELLGIITTEDLLNFLIDHLTVQNQMPNIINLFEHIKSKTSKNSHYPLL